MGREVFPTCDKAGVAAATEIQKAHTGGTTAKAIQGIAGHEYRRTGPHALTSDQQLAFEDVDDLIGSMGMQRDLFVRCDAGLEQLQTIGV